MTCKDFERRLTDYFDDGGDIDQQRRMERHTVSCPECAEQLNDARFALDVLRQAPKVEPPAELVADILHETIGVNATLPVPAGAGGGAHGGLWGFFEPLLHPMLQPRLVMGMAMTMVSFSMLGLHGKSLIEIWNAGRV